MGGTARQKPKRHCARASGSSASSSSITSATFRVGSRDQMRVITLNDDAALINYAESIVAELHANKVRVEVDCSGTHIGAKIANAEQSCNHTLLVIGNRRTTDVAGNC